MKSRWSDSSMNEVYSRTSYELLEEAQARANKKLDEDVQVYTAGILARLFEGDICDMDKPLAIAYMESASSDNVFVRVSGLKTVADGALVLAGLFPLFAERKNVSITYFTEIGTNAYCDLGSNSKYGNAIFYKMYVDFVSVRNVLNKLMENRYTVEHMRKLTRAGYDTTLGDNIIVGPWK